MKRDSEPIRLTRDMFSAASAVLARAFHGDPSMGHFLPDAERRRVLAPKLFRCSLRYGALCGEMWTTSDRLEGVAVWVPPEAAHASTWVVARAGFCVLPLSIGPRFFLRLLSYHRRSARAWFPRRMSACG